MIAFWTLEITAPWTTLGEMTLRTGRGPISRISRLHHKWQLLRKLSKMVHLWFIWDLMNFKNSVFWGPCSWRSWRRLSAWASSSFLERWIVRFPRRFTVNFARAMGAKNFSALQTLTDLICLSKSHIYHYIPVSWVLSCPFFWVMLNHFFSRQSCSTIHRPLLLQYPWHRVSHGPVAKSPADGKKLQIF
jgi:hypothetical protein